MLRADICTLSVIRIFCVANAPIEAKTFNSLVPNRMDRIHYNFVSSARCGILVSSQLLKVVKYKQEARDYKVHMSPFSQKALYKLMLVSTHGDVCDLYDAITYLISTCKRQRNTQRAIKRPETMSCQ